MDQAPPGIRVVLAWWTKRDILVSIITRWGREHIPLFRGEGEAPYALTLAMGIRAYNALFGEMRLI